MCVTPCARTRAPDRNINGNVSTAVCGVFVFVCVCVCVFVCVVPYQVQAKESMLTILAVCMFGTSTILESMAASLDTQVCTQAKSSSPGVFRVVLEWRIDRRRPKENLNLSRG